MLLIKSNTTKGLDYVRPMNRFDEVALNLHGVDGVTNLV